MWTGKRPKKSSIKTNIKTNFQKKAVLQKPFDLIKPKVTSSLNSQPDIPECVTERKTWENHIVYDNNFLTTHSTLALVYGGHSLAILTSAPNERYATAAFQSSALFLMTQPNLTIESIPQGCPPWILLRPIFPPCKTL